MKTSKLRPWSAFVLAMAVCAFAAKAQEFTFTHVGGGLLGGTFTTNAEPGSFTLVGGGEDIWSASDSFDFAYKEVTGDFDIRVKVESVEATGQWTKAGIMARETVAGDSRMAFSKVTPSAPVAAGASCGPNGQGDVSFMYRTWQPTGGGNGGEHEDNIVPGGNNYPTYSWIRLVRRGSVFSAYASQNGYEWAGPQTQDSATWLSPIGGAGSPAPMASALVVGLGVSRHGCSPANELATTVFRYVDTKLEVVATNVTVLETRTATFGVILSGIANWTEMQWLENGVAIPDATNQAYTTAATTEADNGKRYSFRATDTLSGQTFNSPEATLTVLSDRILPTLVSASIGTTDNTITLNFSEAVTEASATNVANYTLTGGVTVNSAVLQAGNQTVVLTTSPMTRGQTYTLTINGIQDRAPIPNTIAANTTAELYIMTWVAGLVKREYWLTNNGAIDEASFPKTPATLVCYTNHWEQFRDWTDNYRARMSAYFVATETGPHKFYVAADDNAWVLLSTDENPANKTLIAREPAWANAREYNGNGGDANVPRNGTNISPAIELTAGNQYYLETRMNEGGGGDNFALTVQMPSQAEGPTNGAPPIQAANIGTYVDARNTTVTIAQQPVNVTIDQFGFATFTAGVNIQSDLCGPKNYQWYSNDVAIAGANDTTYRFGPVDLDADGAVYKLKADYFGVTAETTGATLTVSPDVNPPTVVAVTSQSSFENIYLTFSELMVEQLVEDSVAYTVTDAASNMLTVDGAELQPDGVTVKLILSPTTPMLPDSTYTVTVSQDVTDLAGNNLTGDPKSFETWTESCSPFVFEAYPTGGGTAVNLLTGHASYPNNPDDVRALNVFDTRAALGTDNYRDNYGARLRGLFMVPTTGNYIFYLHSDDASELYVNTNGMSPAGKVKIVEELGCCRDWPTVASTVPVYLQANTPYYIEGLWKEGGGGDYIRVAARLQGSAEALSAITAPSRAPHGAAGHIQFTQMPANATVLENTVVSFTAATTNPNNLNTCYQWQASTDGGTTWTNIPGATGTSYSARVTLADNGTQFRVEAGMLGDKQMSAAATITVEADVVAPVAQSAKADQDPGIVYVKFSELVDAVTAADAVNYVIDDGASGSYTVDSATLLADGMTVRLQISPNLPENIAASVQVQNVNDMAATPNQMDAATLNFRTFKFVPGFLTFEAYNTGGGTAVDLLTNHVSYPDSPRERFYMSRFDTRTVYPDDTHDNYGARVRGLFIPSTTGNWIFYTSSDDASQLWMNTNLTDSANPDGKVLIAQEVGCCGAYMAQPDPRTSLAIYLEAGQKYYIEGLVKEGGGGDYLRVAATLEGQPVPANTVYIMSDMIGTYVDPTGDPAVTISAQPVAAEACYVVGQLPPSVQFCVTAAGTRAGAAERVYYQWQKDTGTGFVDVFNALGNCYSYTPALTDNGAKLRVVAVVPGGEPVTSEAVTLTVLQANTPPSFTKGADITIDEDAGPQTVAGWATGIQAHSISRTPVTLNYDFASMPSGAESWGQENDAANSRNNLIEDGILKLTKAVNGAGGVFYTPAVSQTIEYYTVSFKTIIGGASTCCNTWPSPTSMADGMSLNVANDLPYPGTQNNPGEEGAGTGLIVSFDTWDNGGGEAPAFELKWKGASLGTVKPPEHIAQPVSASPRWIDVNLTVDADGLATLSYDGTNVFENVQLPGYEPAIGLRVGLGARTGGANANHWIDDLRVQAFVADASSYEVAQTMQFVTSNDNPSLFSVQPALSLDGTLTYTPAPNAFGEATVSVVAKDNGGVACSGVDTSAAQTFVIKINPVNDLPKLSYLGFLNLREDTVGGPIAFTAEDMEMPNLTISVQSSNPNVVPPANVQVLGTGSHRTLTVLPVPNKVGRALVTVTATDNDGASVSRTFSVNVREINDAPTIGLAQNLVLTQGAGQQVVNLSGITAGGGEAQTLSVSAVSLNPAVCPDPVVAYTSPGTTGTLTLTPSTTTNGVADIVVTVKDSGGIADGGVDTTVLVFAVIINPAPPAGSPVLGVTKMSGAGYQIKWPTNAVNFKLQATTSLPPVGGWTDVTAAPSVVGDQNVVTEAVTGQSKIYRLVPTP